MAFDYSKYKALADEKLAQYGQDISILGPTFTNIASAKAIYVSPSEKDVPASLIERVDAIFYCSHNVNLVKDNYLEWNGIRYAIVEVNRTVLTNQDIITKILASSGG